jgi:hypothetical protein
LQGLGDSLLEPLFDGGFRAGGFRASDLCGGNARRKGAIGHGRGGGGRFEEDSIDDGFDGVVFAAIKQEWVSEVANLAIDTGTKALLVQLIEQIFELAFAAADDGGHDGYALAFAEFEDARNNLLGCLAGDGTAAVGAMRRTHRGIEEPQVVVDFSDGTDRGTRAAAGGLLLDGDSRRQAFNRVHIGPLNLIEKLSRVGGKGFDVATLAFSVDGVEGERALA